MNYVLAPVRISDNPMLSRIAGEEPGGTSGSLSVGLLHGSCWMVRRPETIRVSEETIGPICRYGRGALEGIRATRTVAHPNLRADWELPDSTQMAGRLMADRAPHATESTRSD